jgi:endonuclease/exonuclease/phosphatase family metal-dependent hydrolase
MRRLLLTVGLCALFVVSASAAEITIVSWNVESGGADPAVAATRIAEMDGVDIWGFCEVQDATWAQTFKTAAAVGEPGTFESILGTTGGTDKLLILYDTTQFTKLQDFEIDWQDRPWCTPSMTPRSPLVVKLKHNGTGKEFFFMVNHLYRGNGIDPRRLDQATVLNQWAAGQNLPVIAVGDYNFDYDLDPGQQAQNYDKGLGNMCANGTFTWLIPNPLVKTEDSSYNSILDFVFLANCAGSITGTSAVLQKPGDFPDDSSTSDHRPVQAILSIGDGTGPSLKEQILKRIAQMEQELAELKVLVQQINQ